MESLFRIGSGYDLPWRSTFRAVYNVVTVTVNAYKPLSSSLQIADVYTGRWGGLTGDSWDKGWNICSLDAVSKRTRNTVNEDKGIACLGDNFLLVKKVNFILRREDTDKWQEIILPAKLTKSAVIKSSERKPGNEGVPRNENWNKENSRDAELLPRRTKMSTYFSRRRSHASFPYHLLRARYTDHVTKVLESQLPPLNGNFPGKRNGKEKKREAK